MVIAGNSAIVGAANDPGAPRSAGLRSHRAPDLRSPVGPMGPRSAATQHTPRPPSQPSSGPSRPPGAHGQCLVGLPVAPSERGERTVGPPPPERGRLRAPGSLDVAAGRPGHGSDRYPARVSSCDGPARVSVRVVPRSGRDEVAGERDGRLVVRTTAPPVDDRANQAVCRLVADYLGVPRGRVSIDSGHHSRYKVVRIDV
jgi:uncharacterized protein YggU (UPF0235/DUF167 family)